MMSVEKILLGDVKMGVCSETSLMQEIEDNIKKQEQDFYNLLFSQIEELNKAVSKIVEFELCFHAYREEPIREVDHSFDPEWDYSGMVISTLSNFSKDITITLGQMSEMYTGNTEATYCSGCGFHHTSYLDECKEMAEEFVRDFCSLFVEECIKRKLFINFLERKICPETSEPDEWDYCDVFDFVCDVCMDLMCKDKFDIFGTSCKNKVWEQRICDTCKKYENIFASYFAEEKARNDMIRSVQNKYNAMAKAIIVPERFKQKICKTKECKELRAELEQAYTEEQMAILFGTEKLIGSNAYAEKYKNMFHEMVFKDIPCCPNVYDHLEEIQEPYQLKVIKKAFDKYQANLQKE